MQLSVLQVVLLFAFCNLIACAQSFEANPESTVTVTEPEYCGTSISLPGGTFTITGTAQFTSRVTVTSAGAWYLDYTFNTKPIAYAEFHVYDSANKRIQCGETASNGTFSTQIPNTPNTQYTLKIFSRANNSFYKASILNDVNNNLPYSVSKPILVVATTPGDIGSVLAEGDDTTDPTITGAAFNILNNIYLVNNFLRSAAASAGFTVAPKVSVYWKAGFNPNTYRGGSSTQGISYYIPGRYQLYIQGGINGDVASSDTDHFDDSIIVHEYGHFLEDIFGKTDSPGGSHNGDAVIDPRLAWSEGWANYLQSAVKTAIAPAAAASSTYIDTFGYKQNSGDPSGYGNLTVFDLTDDPLSGTTYDRPNAASEGLFREVSISRTLFKTTAPSSVAYTYSNSTKPSIQIPFVYVWRAFSVGDVGVEGMNSSNRHFRSMGLFNSIFRTLLTSSADSGKRAAWEVMVGEEMQPLDNLEYGAGLVNAPACRVSLTPNRNASSGTSLGTLNGASVFASNQLASNDFYRYYYDGSNPSLTLEYTQPGNPPTVPIVDLNMHIYPEDYVYFEDVYATMGKSSPYIMASTSPAIGISNTSKSVSLAGRPAGYYLINVKAKTSNSNGSDKSAFEVGTIISYQLSNIGGLLCPQTP